MPSNKAKQRWNAAHYTQVKVSVNPNIAAAFKATCAENGNSQAYVLSTFMSDSSRSTEHERSSPAEEVRPLSSSKTETTGSLETRKKRRAAVKEIAARLEDVLAAEERFYDNVPDNLQGAKWHEASETSISAMQEVLELLFDIYT
jgi:hypothetical protein